MFKKIIIIILDIFVFTLISFSQQLPISNQYFVDKFSLSPAFAGLSNHTEGFLGFRQNWVGVVGAPTLASLDVNGALGSHMGLGISINTERTGNFTNMYVSGTWAYHVNTGTNSVLSFGLEPKFYSNQLDISNIQSYGSVVDPVIQNNNAIVGNVPDVGGAVLFKANNFIIGVSVPRTLGLNMKYANNVSNFKLQRQYVGHIAYGFKASEKILITPMAVVRTTENSKLNYDASFMLEYNENLWTGFGYRAGNTIIANVGGSVSDWFVVNYFYEFGLKNLSSASGGTHEISIGFLFNRSQTPNEPSIFPSKATSGTDPELENQVKKLIQDVNTERKERKSDVEDLKKMIKDLEDLISKNVVVPKDSIATEKDEWVYTVNSDKILFGKGSNRLLSSSLSEISKYAQKLVEDETLKMQIVGHTDDIGSAQYNLDLSKSRAQVVAEEVLKVSGIEPEQVVYVGKGEDEPLLPNTTPENRRLNNRIQFKFNKAIDN